MPPVAQFTIAYGAGLWAGLVLLVPLPAACVAVAAAVVAALRWSAWRGILLVAIASGAVVGTKCAARRRQECAVRWRAGRETALVRVHDAVGPRGTTDATVAWSPSGCGGALRLAAGDATLPAGRRAIVIGTYRGLGVLQVRHARILRGRPLLRDALRDLVRRRIAHLFGTRGPVVDALVVGRRYDIPKALRNRFADSGLAHLLAISGLHVGIVATWLVVLLRLLRVGTFAPGLGALGTWLYVALLGFPASATRAAAFVTTFAVSQGRQRHPPMAATVAVAVLAVLTVNPEAVTAVGAWLSVAAVTGAAWGRTLLPSRWRRLPLLGLLGSSIGAVLFTAPITALTFGSVSPAGIVSNLVAVPLAALAVPAVLVSLVVGWPAAAGAGLALAGIEFVARVAARIPGGHLTGVPGVTFALPWGVLVVLAMIVTRRGPRMLPRAMVKRAAIAAASGWVLVSGLSVHRQGRGLIMSVLDVGQGDAIAIRTPHRRWVLVDAGARSPVGDAGRTVVTPFLRHRGAEKLAALIATHGDADHLGGVPSVLRAFGTALVLEPGQPLPTPLYQQFLATVEGEGDRWVAARAGDTLVVDSVVFVVLHPNQRWMERQFEPNENSVVLRLQYGCFSAVLTGDAGAPVESLLAPTVGSVDLLKVGHHGSTSATTELWLDSLRPRVAIVSVGARNSYGQPSEEVLDRLTRHGVIVRRTDQGGTVTARTDGRYLWVGQGAQTSIWETAQCWIRRLSRSSGSSSNRNACTPKPLVTLPICSTTSPSPPR